MDDVAAAGENLDAFHEALRLLAPGYSEGRYAGQRYGVTLTISPDARRTWLYGEQLGGAGRVSFNLYRLAGDRLELRPCEMPREWVIDFVLRFEPDKME